MRFLNDYVEGYLKVPRTAASVRSHVGEDITRCQDDAGSVQNCSNLCIVILIFLEAISGANSLERSFQKWKIYIIFYMCETGVLFAEGFAEKLLFSFKHKVVRGCSGHCLARLRHTQVLPIFSEILSAIYMCVKTAGESCF